MEEQADGEWLASPHDQTVYTIQISTMVCVVELTLQVPAINVQSFKEEREIFFFKQKNLRLIPIKEVFITYL